MIQYRGLGYDVVAVTDHWKTNDLSGLGDEGFLVINGMESHPKGNHFVCLNLPEGFDIKKDMDPQKAIDSVNAVGGGVWISFLGPANTMSLAIVRNEVGTTMEQRISVYVQGGFAF